MSVTRQYVFPILRIVIWAVIAAVLFLVGRNQIKEVQGAPRTVESLGKIPDALKRNEENR